MSQQSIYDFEIHFCHYEIENVIIYASFLPFGNIIICQLIFHYNIWKFILFTFQGKLIVMHDALDGATRIMTYPVLEQDLSREITGASKLPVTTAINKNSGKTN